MKHENIVQRIGNPNFPEDIEGEYGKISNDIKKEIKENIDVLIFGYKLFEYKKNRKKTTLEQISEIEKSFKVLEGERKKEIVDYFNPYKYAKLKVLGCVDNLRIESPLKSPYDYIYTEIKNNFKEGDIFQIPNGFYTIHVKVENLYSEKPENWIDTIEESNKRISSVPNNIPDKIEDIEDIDLFPIESRIRVLLDTKINPSYLAGKYNNVSGKFAGITLQEYARGIQYNLENTNRSHPNDNTGKIEGTSWIEYGDNNEIILCGEATENDKKAFKLIFDFLQDNNKSLSKDYYGKASKKTTYLKLPPKKEEGPEYEELRDNYIIPDICPRCYGKGQMQIWYTSFSTCTRCYGSGKFKN